jgi:hypothetical protein
MATSGDFGGHQRLPQMATSGDFLMATDTGGRMALRRLGRTYSQIYGQAFRRFMRRRS